MNNYMVKKNGKNTIQGSKYFDNLAEALDDAKRKSKKYGAEYCVLKAYKKEGSNSSYYMQYANFINGKRTI